MEKIQAFVYGNRVEWVGSEGVTTGERWTDALRRNGSRGEQPDSIIEMPWRFDTGDRPPYPCRYAIHEAGRIREMTAGEKERKDAPDNLAQARATVQIAHADRRDRQEWLDSLDPALDADEITETQAEIAGHTAEIDAVRTEIRRLRALEKETDPVE